eukprot:1083723-Pyramimonas_sp.AAC.3
MARASCFSARSVLAWTLAVALCVVQPGHVRADEYDHRVGAANQTMCTSNGNLNLGNISHSYFCCFGLAALQGITVAVHIYGRAGSKKSPMSAARRSFLLATLDGRMNDGQSETENGHCL